MNRCFFVDPIGETGSCFELESGENRHLFRTLRAKTGDHIELIDGRGTIATAEVESGHRLRLTSRKQVHPLLSSVHLFFATVRKQQLEVILRQSVELGAATLHPVIMERSVARPEGNDGGSRWRSIAIEACKQSRNPYLPEVHPPQMFSDIISLLRNQRYHIFHGDRNSRFTGTDKSTAIQENAKIAWIVGPEGGFSDSEMIALADSGSVPLSLGPWILRTETAAICGLALLNHLFLSSFPDQSCGP